MKKQQTFETASADLDDILQELSKEDTSLERSLELYAKAAELVAFCNEELSGAQVKIDEITQKLDASLSNQKQEEL